MKWIERASTWLRPGLSLWILGIGHGVGVVGSLVLGGNNPYPWLSAVFLVVSGLMVSFHHQGEKGGNLALLLAIAGTAWAIEVAGVQTGAIFGSYGYGPALGPSIWGVPPLIGVNWALLTYLAVQGLPGLRPHAAAGISALVLVNLDLWMEPVAPKMGLWTFTPLQPPFQNYMAWFIMAYLFVFILKKWAPPSRNPIAAGLLIIQIAFFVLMNLVYLTPS